MCAKNDEILQDKLLKLHDLLLSLNVIEDDKQLLEHIIAGCIELTAADFGSLMIVDWAEKVLNIEVAKGHNSEVRQKVKLKIGEGVTGRVAETGEAELVKDAKKCPYYIEINPEVQSELSVPIKVYGKTIGVISVDSSKRNHFDYISKDILSLLGQQAGRILSNARLFQELSYKFKMQNIILQISELINITDEVKPVFRRIMQILKTEMGIDRALLALSEVNDKELQISESCGIRKSDIVKGKYKIGEGVIGTVFKTGKEIGIDDISSSSLFLNKMQIPRAPERKTSFIAVPIFSDKKVIGVLSVEKAYEKQDYFLEDIDMLKIAASLISNLVTKYLHIKKERLLILQENENLRKELFRRYNFSDIIGRSKAIQSIFEKVSLVADTTAPVLITGASGTGKELLARAIHNNSARKDKPFVAINCAAIPETLLESELFGYKKGAFTGAIADRRGKIELAHGGTLFLDEIGDMAVHLQAKILRVLQEKAFEPVGSTDTKQVNIRIIAATNKDLEDAMQQSTFRSDLYYRLNMVHLNIPALSERTEDIPLLIEHFITKYNAEFKKHIKGIDNEAMQLLLRYPWPGNVRELENSIAQAILLSKLDKIHISSLPPKIVQSMGVQNDKASHFEPDIALTGTDIYDKVVGSYAKSVIEKVLQKCNFNQSKAAKMLGLNRNTLRFKIKKYGISLDEDEV